jgi:hypothetical protein
MDMQFTIKNVENPNEIVFSEKFSSEVNKEDDAKVTALLDKLGDAELSSITIELKTGVALSEFDIDELDPESILGIIYHINQSPS